MKYSLLRINLIYKVFCYPSKLQGDLFRTKLFFDTNKFYILNDILTTNLVLSVHLLSHTLEQIVGFPDASLSACYVAQAKNANNAVFKHKCGLHFSNVSKNVSDS